MNVQLEETKESIINKLVDKGLEREEMLNNMDKMNSISAGYQ